MNPVIKVVKERKLIGKQLSMSFTDYRVGELWRYFTLQQEKIINRMGKERISMAIYSPDHFSSFDPSRAFDKWAAVEVKGFDAVPEGLEPFLLPEGLYAVFHYKGLSTDHTIFHYIFEQWLPRSGYELDDRPHFEILGEAYRNNDPRSEEDIYIPVKRKLSI